MDKDIITTTPRSDEPEPAVLVPLLQGAIDLHGIVRLLPVKGAAPTEVDLMMAPSSYLWRKIDSVISQNRNGQQRLDFPDGHGGGDLVVVDDVDEDPVLPVLQVACHFQLQLPIRMRDVAGFMFRGNDYVVLSSVRSAV